MKKKFIKFFTNRASTDEELNLMRWAKEKKENEDELIHSLKIFHMIDLLSSSSEMSRKYVPFITYIKSLVSTKN